MAEDTLQDLMVELTRRINECPGISAEGLHDTLFPDDLISAIHNHLGNANQLVSSSYEAANGAEQFTALKAAQKELDALRDSLLAATQTNLLGEESHREIDAKIVTLMEVISDTTDPEYQ